MLINLFRWIRPSTDCYIRCFRYFELLALGFQSCAALSMSFYTHTYIRCDKWKKTWTIVGTTIDERKTTKKEWKKWNYTQRLPNEWTYSIQVDLIWWINVNSNLPNQYARRAARRLLCIHASIARYIYVCVLGNENNRRRSQHSWETIREYTSCNTISHLKKNII